MRTRLGRAIGVLCLGVMAGSSFNVVAQESHALHKMAGPKKVELGTTVAADARGRLWAASKETAGDAQYVVLQTSDDQGGTWSAPRRIHAEPEAIAADGENRPKLAFGMQREIYITYTKPLAKPYTGEIRFIRSLDGGETFQPPITVHANREVITHRFDSMVVDRNGRIYITWIDKRDFVAAGGNKDKYRGAAVYYAVSENGGAGFRGDFKIADHTCECCRIALALGPDGRPVALWRHVFEPGVRDHAMAVLTPEGKVAPASRATFDNWRIDACPHHGPALAFAADGTRHQVWFNVIGDEGGVFYASADEDGQFNEPVRLGSAQAQHADVAVAGANVVLAWKQFDGKSTVVLTRTSNDGGRTWQEKELASTNKASDQPRLVKTPSGIVMSWRTQAEGLRLVPVNTEK